MQYLQELVSTAVAQNGDHHHPVVMASSWYKSTPDQYWTDGAYFDPYYNVGNEWLTFIGEMF